jgi:PPOX class probable F420-dependent enzyme
LRHASETRESVMTPFGSLIVVVPGFTECVLASGELERRGPTGEFERVDHSRVIAMDLGRRRTDQPRRGNMASIITEDVRTLIDSGPLAHLTTLNADGSPQVSVVWIGIEANEFVCGHMGVWQKVKNIRRDPRVALSLLGRGKNPLGLEQYLVVYGEARISEGGAVPLLQRLAHIYLGPAVVFPPEPLRNRPGYVTHIAPHRFAGVGPWSSGQD